MFRIGALANIDDRLAEALRRRRAGTWTYGGRTESSSLLTSLASDLGYPSTWGDSSIVPSNGGANADQIWDSIGVTSRPGVGGIPCELVHGNVGGFFGNVGPSCSKNVAIRGLMGFVQAFAIYAPVCRNFIFAHLYCVDLITFQGPFPTHTTDQATKSKKTLHAQADTHLRDALVIIPFYIYFFDMDIRLHDSDLVGRKASSQYLAQFL